MEENNDDLGSVTLPIIVENINFDKALIDLGSSINLLSISAIRKIGNLDLKPTTMMLQLANKSIRKPVGIVQDVVVKLKKFQFPTDFVVMNIDEDKYIPLILGRTFMKIARMMIDMDEGGMKVRYKNKRSTSNYFKLCNTERKTTPKLKFLVK